MNCPSCGSQMPDGAKFCATCGYAMTATPEAAPAAQSSGVVLNGQPVPASSQNGQAVYAVPAGTPQAAPVVNVNVTAPAQTEPRVYECSDSDKTLYLIAFILNLITTICVGWLILPLAWMIPMTVHTWGIYKGSKPNTTGFGVCTLIFLDFISGILLLVAKKHA